MRHRVHAWPCSLRSRCVCRSPSYLIPVRHHSAQAGSLARFHYGKSAGHAHQPIAICNMAGGSRHALSRLSAWHVRIIQYINLFSNKERFSAPDYSPEFRATEWRIPGLTRPHFSTAFHRAKADASAFAGTKPRVPAYSPTPRDTSPNFLVFLSHIRYGVGTFPVACARRGTAHKGEEDNG